MLYEKIVDAITGEETLRPFTVDEIAEYEANTAKIAEEVAQREADEAAQLAKKDAIAARLGLSADELKTLLS